MRVLSALVCTMFLGCTEPLPVDPDGRDQAAASVTPTVALDELVGAMAGVPREAAPSVLERWLRDANAPLLTTWPRNPGGGLDFSRAPVAIASIEASIGPGSRSRCGEVVVELVGPMPPRLRAHLAIPRSAPDCRGISRESRRTGGEALPLLEAAIAHARVPSGRSSVPIAAR